jgi:hypothetical protein
MWLKQEKNKEKEIEEIKTPIQKLQKQKSDLIREKDIIYTEKLTEIGEKID